MVDRILSSGAVYLSLLDSNAVISKPKVSISIKDSNTIYFLGFEQLSSK
nr:hypothetical protein [Paenibacillus xylanexedens]